MVVPEPIFYRKKGEGPSSNFASGPQISLDGPEKNNDSNNNNSNNNSNNILGFSDTSSFFDFYPVAQSKY